MKYLINGLSGCSMRTSLIVFGSLVFLCVTLPPAAAQESSAPVDQSGQISDGPQGNVAPEDSSSDATAEARSFTRNVSDELVRLGIPQPLPFLWDLAVQGGLFMIPIALCSIVVMAYAIERRIGLRRNLIIPPGLLVGLQKLNQQSSGIDPRLAYDVCLTYRSPLARVLQAAILKVGRPQAELEKAVEDAVGREADQMAQNIRPINVAVSISPMLGLLGTVQGMIMAFMVISASTSTGTAKGQELAQGIYTALITTFAGLIVAIPAIVIANMLEGRIERLLRGMEDVFNEIVPLFERFEGKWRVTRKSDASGVLLKGTGPRPESTSSSKSGSGEMNATIDDRSALRTVTASASPGVREKS
ncbi:MAG: MotA/TolQ/ExbB proton channel family protein [Planctomycetota bacterium]|nr:MAG: MotA/TolQ/ExbB proton channel family protein [Planctomycetota bacterium]